MGPSTDDPEVMRALMENGMDVARFNFSHGTHEEQLKRLKQLRHLRAETGKHAAALLDTKGPEIRLGLFRYGKAELKAGDTFVLTTEECEGNSQRAYINYPGLPGDVKPGAHLLLDDGKLSLEVASVQGGEITCTVMNDGIISDRKSVNAPGVVLNMPFISKKDYDDIIFGATSGFDFVAASFVRTADDVKEVRLLLNWNGGEKVKIISKIENLQGIENFDEILAVSDGIMIARGDMGVELPMEEVPVIQKQLIKKVFEKGKPVITATQMLESMMNCPRPTRAETSDVANAIYDGSSAIMLSGETAAGKYPVEALKAMVRLAERTERDIDYIHDFQKRDYYLKDNITHAISHAACTSAMELGAEAIVTFTLSGRSAQEVSAFRPGCRIIACTSSEESYRQMNLNWGVEPFMTGKGENLDSLIDNGIAELVKAGKLKQGDMLVIAAGVPIGISGATNFIKVVKA